MKLAASIVTYRTDTAELASALNCLQRAGVSCIYVVDNSSLEAIKEVCTSRDGVTYIPSENRGFGAGHNIALRKSLTLGTTYHLVMNSDVAFDPTAISTLIAYMDAHPEAGAAQPRIVGADGRLQYTVRMLPTPFDLILRRFIPKWAFPGRRARYELHHLDHSLPFNVPYHQGSFMFLRMDALRKAGLFDERFFMYPEDIDLTRRIHANACTMYLPSATVVHYHRRESYRSFRMLRIHCVNMIRYFNKWGWWSDPVRRRVNRLLRP